MFNQQQQNPGNGNDVKNTVNWIVFIMRSIAVTVEVFLHRNFGANYIGAQGLVGLLVIFFFAGFIGVPGSGAVMGFLAAYLFACLVARADIAGRQKRGLDTEHSFYTGWPRLMKLFPRCSELTVKRFIEPALVAVVGCMVMNAVPALGLYLLMAGGVLFIMVNHDEAEQQRRIRNMRDAFIDASQRAEWFRSMNDRR